MLKHILFLLLVSSFTTFAQSIDSSQFAPFEVEVINFENIPQQGESIIFEAVNSDLVYMGTTNEKGKFYISIKGNETYSVKIKSVGKDADYTTFEVPKLPDGKVYSTSKIQIQFELPKTFTLDNVEFETSKATLNKVSYAELNELLEYMKLKPSLEIEIAGHTDDVGEEESNIALSQKRAEKVKSYLVSKGISKNRIVAKGYGETQPIASNETPEGRQKNRRTEVRITKE